MITETQIAPQNSVLVIMDKAGGEIPESMNHKLVVATPSCIAVGTLSQADGETSVTLTDETMQPQRLSGLEKVFSGVLATPTKEVHIFTVLLHSVLTLSVRNTQSNVEVWANSDTEPDKLCVAIT
jgi:hypothetical protein